MEGNRLIAHEKEQIERWIRQAKGGSAGALANLLQACRDYLKSLAHQALSASLRAKVAPSDLMQETLLDAHRDFREFHGEHLEELLAWLRQILSHNAASAGHHYSIAKRQLSREVSLDATGELPDGALSPRSLASAVEEHEKVERALACLPDDRRMAIVLRSREHCSFAEVGVRMRRSAEAARKLWSRAIEQLQEELLKTDERLE